MLNFSIWSKLYLSVLETHTHTHMRTHTKKDFTIHYPQIGDSTPTSIQPLLTRNKDRPIYVEVTQL